MATAPASSLHMHVRHMGLCSWTSSSQRTPLWPPLLSLSLLSIVYGVLVRCSRPQIDCKLTVHFFFALRLVAATA
jgi:hypothetical protein